MSFLKWLWNLDRAANADMGGDPEETLSETWARWRLEGNRFQRTWGWGSCAVLNLFDRGHCDKVLARARAKDAAPNPDPADSDPPV